MINATISARLTGQAVPIDKSCLRPAVLSVYVKDGWYDEPFEMIAYGKAADTLTNFAKPKIMVTGEWVIRKPGDGEGPDKILEFHVSKIHNAK